MSGYPCPKGHLSSTDDFCDTCGTRIAAAVPGTTTGSTATPAAGSGAAGARAATPSAGQPVTGGPVAACPNCGTPRAGAERFCEDCGFDHTTGKVPAFGPPGGATGKWTATVTADRAYFDANAIDGVDFPAHRPEREVSLPAPQVRIGRRSGPDGGDGDLDLSGQPPDPGISHHHALLTLGIDGVWRVSDLGSTNGTYVNDEPAPLTAGQSRALADGDRLHVGAWTTITLHAPPTAPG